ncbi:MAG: DNA polymerase III subunit gamma/tau, partial [Vulcanococcus sp.]
PSPPPATQVTPVAPPAPQPVQDAAEPEPGPTSAAASTPPATVEPVPEPPRAQPSQLDDQAKRLADFFNGEVVALDGPIPELEAS